MHPCCHINSELQQLLRGQRGSRAMLLGKGRIGLQHPTLPQEVEKVSVWSIFDGYVQITWMTERKRKWLKYTDKSNRAVFRHRATLMTSINSISSWNWILGLSYCKVTQSYTDGCVFVKKKYVLSQMQVPRAHVVFVVVGRILWWFHLRISTICSYHMWRGRRAPWWTGCGTCVYKCNWIIPLSFKRLLSSGPAVCNHTFLKTEKKSSERKTSWWSRSLNKCFYASISFFSFFFFQLPNHQERCSAVVDLQDCLCFSFLIFKHQYYQRSFPPTVLFKQHKDAGFLLHTTLISQQRNSLQTSVRWDENATHICPLFNKLHTDVE